jgi:glutamyl-tRNA reductase
MIPSCSRVYDSEQKTYSNAGALSDQGRSSPIAGVSAIYESKEEPMDIFDFLERENEKILITLQKLEDISPRQAEARKALLAEASERILTQFRIEEEHLYPYLQLNPLTREHSEVCRAENHETESVLTQLYETAPSDKRFQYLAERLHGRMMRQSMRREKELFPQLREILSSEQREMLGQKAQVTIQPNG